MHAPASEPRKKVWHEKLMRSGYFFGAVLFHLILFLLVATVVVWKVPAPPDEAKFNAVAVKVAVPPPMQPPASGAQANNQFEPQPVTIPVVTPPSTISTITPSEFRVDATKVLNQAMTHVSLPAAQGTGLAMGGSSGNSGAGTGFGSANGSSNQLAGYFYDMKQTFDRKQTEYNSPDSVITDKWVRFVSKYVSSGWDDAMLAPYYKSKSPLYTDCFSITPRLSEEAPTAFHLEKEVQPARWIVHYHGKVIAPEAGEYRFVGCGDDLMVVKINGTLVLDAGWEPLTNKKDLHKPYPFVWFPADVGSKPEHSLLLKGGASFHVDTAEAVDMDVLIGDEGGNCAFFLMIEKIGSTYEQLPDGTPKLPFFQIGAKTAPTFKTGEDHPPYSTTPESWQAAD